MDIGGDGRLYVASWRGGEASVYVGPQVGFLTCLTPPGWSPTPPASLNAATLAELLDGLSSPSAAASFHCQREILRRGPSPEATRLLVNRRPTPHGRCTGEWRPSSHSSNSTAPIATRPCGNLRLTRPFASSR